MKLPKSYMSAKHEVNCLSNARIMKVVLSCHGTRIARQQVPPDIVVAPWTYVPNVRFVCYQQQTCEGISLLPWIHGFHSYKLHTLFLLPRPVDPCVPKRPVRFKLSVRTGNPLLWVSQNLLTNEATAPTVECKQTKKSM